MIISNPDLVNSTFYTCQYATQIHLAAGDVEFYRKLGNVTGNFKCEQTKIETLLTEWLNSNRHLAPIIVAAFAFAESCVGIGIFVSGAFLLIATTLLLNNDVIGLYQIGFLAFAGAVAGDQVGFWLGHRAGPGFHHSRLAQKYATQLNRGEQLILRHGSFAVFIGRFIPAIRSLVPALLGVSGFGTRKYVILDIAACVTWAIALCILTLLSSKALG